MEYNVEFKTAFVKTIQLAWRLQPKQILAWLNGRTPNLVYVHIICPDGIVAFPVSAIGDDARWDAGCQHWLSDEDTNYWIGDGSLGFYAGWSFDREASDEMCSC